MQVYHPKHTRENMRHKIVLVLLLSFATLHSTPQAAHQLSRAAIEVGGTKLRLGMSKAQVAEKLVGNEITKLDEDTWILGSVEKSLGPEMQFTNGALSFANREWTTSSNDVGEALFGVVSSLNAEGYSQCSVTADTRNSPSLNAQRVFISCKEKTIAVVRRSFSGHSGTSVYEQLGSMRVTE
jgi:hypothetical protein